LIPGDDSTPIAQSTRIRIQRGDFGYVQIQTARDKGAAQIHRSQLVKRNSMTVRQIIRIERIQQVESLDLRCRLLTGFHAARAITGKSPIR